MFNNISMKYDNASRTLGVLFVSIAVFCFAPSVSLAAHTAFVCSDFSLSGSATCVNTGPAPSTAVIGLPGHGHVNTTGTYPYSTWYVSTVVDDGGVGLYDLNTDHSTGITVSGNQTDAVITGAVSGDHFYVSDDSGSDTFNGNVSEICISDTLGECASILPPTPHPAPFPNGSEVFPGQEASTTFAIVDNPNQDFFNGMLLP